ncbi:MAG: outer membrane beta-barrel protein [Gemmatimonadota bacterium]
MRPRSYWLRHCITGFALLPAQLAAQTHYPIGFIGGVSSADFRGKDVAGGKSSTGLVLGGLIHLELAGPLTLEPQLLYVQKGGRLVGGGVTATFKMGYLQLPLLLRLELPLRRVSRLALGLIAGPALALTTSCTTRLEAVSYNPVDTGCLGAGASVRETDFSVIGGAGIGLGALALEGRYDLGLNRIGTGSAAGDVKNRALLLTLAYRF